MMRKQKSMPTETSTSNQVRETASAVTDTAKRTLTDVTGQVKEKTASAVDQQRETTAASLASVADAVRRMGEGLRDQQNGPVAAYAAQYGESLAGQVERLSNYLRERDARQLISDVESFARRRPAWFVGGAFLLGLAGTRFLKSSSPQAAASGGAGMLPVGDYTDTPAPSSYATAYDPRATTPLGVPDPDVIGGDELPDQTRTPVL